MREILVIDKPAVWEVTLIFDTFVLTQELNDGLVCPCFCGIDDSNGCSVRYLLFLPDKLNLLLQYFKELVILYRCMAVRQILVISTQLTLLIFIKVFLNLF